jgi:hypothetical protein
MTAVNARRRRLDRLFMARAALFVTRVVSGDKDDTAPFMTATIPRRYFDVETDHEPRTRHMIDVASHFTRKSAKSVTRAANSWFLDQSILENLIAKLEMSDLSGQIDM